MKKYIVLIFSLLLVACSVTKKVPDGSYLLNSTEIKSDIGGIRGSSLKPYLRQRPNSSMTLLGKFKLHMYNIPENDSTWINRQLLRYGEPPVLFNEQLTAISAEQIRLHLNNKGYLSAEVDTAVTKSDKRAKVTYDVTGNKPHRIRYYRDSIRSSDTTIHNILLSSRRLELIKADDLFDLSVLEDGRKVLTTYLRNRGYYDLVKDDFYFIADTTVGDHQVDVTLALNNPTDSTLHKQYAIGEVTVINGVRDEVLRDSTRANQLDTIYFRGLRILSEKEPLLRPRAVFYNTFLRPGDSIQISCLSGHILPQRNGACESDFH